MTRYLLAALFVVSLAVIPLQRSAAAPESVLKHRVRPGDTLRLLAAEYYGDRRWTIVIVTANPGLKLGRPLKVGTTIKVPIQRRVVTKVGDTWETIAASHLGDKRRATMLATANARELASLAAGETVQVPLRIRHRVAANETLERLAATFFGTPARASLLRSYNFLADGVKRGDIVEIPMTSVRIRRDRLPPPDAETAARSLRHREENRAVASKLNAAREAWRTGDYSRARNSLIRIRLDYLDVRNAVQVGVLLGRIHVAYNDTDSAEAVFTRVLERAPTHALSTLHYSPKVRAAWKKAGGGVTTKATPQNPTLPPTPNTARPATGCDEVACLLGEYNKPCCAKYRAKKTP